MVVQGQRQCHHSIEADDIILRTASLAPKLDFLDYRVALTAWS